MIKEGWNWQKLARNFELFSNKAHSTLFDLGIIYPGLSVAQESDAAVKAELLKKIFLDANKDSQCNPRQAYKSGRILSWPWRHHFDIPLGQFAVAISTYNLAWREIDYPDVGPVFVAGISLSEAAATISEAISTKFRNVEINISLVDLRQFKVYIGGAVNRPGAYPATPVSRFLI